ncbi:uncharacterized protein ATC70_003653 [Mucor velutinosus]|uniref:Kelch repeat protein n=1 Tax=Mucor velutinosus TaxID=708070 RepID=A0AAN7D8S5_9FUNG|nr:hypothetical protein ATC70_003653 [Mucor velutinosus]
MLLTRAISLLSIFTAVAFAELVPVSPYTGKHKANCQHSKLTGALVDGRIYTFGGCYAIPYIIDPDDESGEPFGRYNDHQNVTESSNVYDIASDTWSFETNTPRLLRGSSTVTINKDIYFYNIDSKPRTTQLNLWKYSTDTKTWSEPDQLPFLIHGSLLTCHSNDKMYFMGSQDGYQRNIVRVQNLLSNQWEDPVYLDKRIYAKKLLCHETHISVIGEKADKEDDIAIFDFQRESTYTQNLINVYHNGSVQIVENFNITLGHSRNGGIAQVFPLKEWFYIFGLDESNSATEISKINTLTLETVKLDTLPYALTNVLMVPTENDEIYLFGGGKEKISVGRPAPKEDQNPSVPKIKTYNHKLIIPPTDVVKESTGEAGKQGGHLKLQAPDK